MLYDENVIIVLLLKITLSPDKYPMNQNNIRQQFKDLHKRIENSAESLCLPSKEESISDFFNECWTSFKFILKEKENILFALLQLATIAIVYYIWVQMIGWIPQEVWDAIEKEEEGGLIVSLVFLAWSFLCVGIAAYPIGIFTACMSASYTLHKEGRVSTILECLKTVLTKSWALWIFSWVDGWITVNIILERLPKKNDRTPRSVKILKELVYQLWKTATLGVIPALIYGRTIEEVCNDSLSLLKNYLFPLGKLRVVYSLFCWIIGIGSYLSLIFLFPHINAFALEHNISIIFAFYLYIGVPLLLALFIIVVLLRPLYIISATRIYMDYATENGLPLRLPTPSSKGLSALIGFVVLCILIALVMLYRDELGITYALQHYL